jgi:hypothetical protein
MFDFNQLLNNDTVKEIIKKTGIPEDKVQAVIKQAASSISKKTTENPAQAASLLSTNPNTAADNALIKAIESDFVKNLIAKVGLPESTAQTAKSMIPQITQYASKAIQNKGFDVNGILNSFTKGSQKNDLMSSISKFAGSFFGKK